MKKFCYRLKKLKPIFYMGFIVLFIGVSSSCGKNDDEVTISSDGPLLSVSDFAGNWTATMAVFENFSGSQRVDIVEVGGSVTFVAQTNRRISITIAVPGQGSEIISGELGFNEEEWGSGLIVIFDGEPRDDYEVYNIDLINDILYLGGLTTFDITGNGTEEPVTINLTLERG